jgi:hypothetical protein
LFFLIARIAGIPYQYELGAHFMSHVWLLLISALGIALIVIGARAAWWWISRDVWNRD